MKKYLSILTAIVTVILSSCSNDDIPVSMSTTFTINPRTVIEPLLDCEIEAGELETLPSGFSLRTQLLIYNEDGKLVQHEEEILPNYTSLMKKELFLPAGQYRAIAVTDVLGSSVNYWEFENLENLSGATIKSTGYIGYEWKILGLQIGNFTVTEDKVTAYTMQPTAFGSLFVVGYNNIHAYSDVEALGLLANRKADQIVFNSVGGHDLVVESNNNAFNWWNNKIVVENFNSSFDYEYSFQLPMNNYSVKFIAETADSYVTLSETWTLNLNPGDGYLFYIDLDDEGEISYFENQIVGTRSATSETPVFDNLKANASRNSVRLQDIKAVELIETKH